MLHSIREFRDVATHTESTIRWAALSVPWLEVSVELRRRN